MVGAVMNSLASTHQLGAERGRLLVRHRGRMILLSVDEINWVEAQEDYVKLHTEGERIQVRGTMKEFEDRLHQFRFARIHRSALVNLDRLKEVRMDGGLCKVLLQCGTLIAVGKRRKRSLRMLLESMHHCVEVKQASPAHREMVNVHL